MKRFLTLFLILMFSFSFAYRTSNWDHINARENLAISGTETVTEASAMSITKGDTVINDTTSSAEVIHTLADADKAGTIKNIVALSVSSSNAVVIENFASGTTINFSAAGDTAMLKFNGTQWYLIGQNSITIE